MKQQTLILISTILFVIVNIAGASQVTTTYYEYVYVDYDLIHTNPVETVVRDIDDGGYGLATVRIETYVYLFTDDDNIIKWQYMSWYDAEGNYGHGSVCLLYHADGTVELWIFTYDGDDIWF